MPSIPPILILEDSRADRARFRHIIPDFEQTCEFAWAWKSANGCSVFQWFRDQAHYGVEGGSVGEDEKARQADTPGSCLLDLLNESTDCKELQNALLGRRLLLLDLAWSNGAERAMQGLQQLDAQTGAAWASATDPGTSESSDGSAAEAWDGQQQLIQRVEGIALLEWLNGFTDSEKRPTVWVTSAYVPTAAAGLRGFLQERYGVRSDLPMYHKWMDEYPLDSALQESGVAAARRTSDERGAAIHP
jgi:hypothetical protein